MRHERPCTAGPAHGRTQFDRSERLRHIRIAQVVGVHLLGCSRNVDERGRGYRQLAHLGHDPERGFGGASTRRECQRRVAKNELNVRAAHPRIGGLILRLQDEPQSTRAWAQGAVGEEKLAQRLNGLRDQGVQLLHDRRIAGSRANIDHIAIGSAGVFVIDAKRYQGQPQLRVSGGVLRPEPKPCSSVAATAPGLSAARSNK